MGKKRKGEKLDQILAEVQKLKAEVKALGKQQADLAVLLDKLTAKKPAARAVRPPAKKAAPSRKASAAPKRPVLVPAADAATKAAG